MAPLVDSEDLVGAAEVAELLGLAQASSVSVYARRYSDFPLPVVELPRSKVRLWLRADIDAFRTRHPGRNRADRSD
jgi:predicted DNA-binding transcriptional regulator AlpA